MVNPLYLIALFLASAFAIALFDKVKREIGLGLLYATLAAALVLVGFRLWELSQNPALQSQFFTAGFEVPLSIGLSFGFQEVILLIVVLVMGFLGSIAFGRRFFLDGAQPMALYMLLLLGASGLILTRDIFNAFVFMEILSIASYALIGIRQTRTSLASGIKYMMAGGISSALLLIGIIFAYRFTGTLNLDMWILNPVAESLAYRVALFLIAMAVFIDLKPFPANGWALDVYQSAHGGMGAVLSSVHSAALIFLMYKLLPLMDYGMLALFAGAGLVSFVMANLIALRQTDAKRLLGYSSTAQTGLLIFIIYGLSNLGVPGYYSLVIAIGFIISNSLAKGGLFWLAEMVEGKSLKSWSALKADSGLLICFGIFTIALVGLPPFPGFFAKWELVRVLFTIDQPYLVIPILIGSLLEAFYMFRWLGFAAKGVSPEGYRPGAHRYMPVVLGVLTLFVVSYLIPTGLLKLPVNSLYPVLGLLVFSLLDFFPARVKGFMAILGLGAYGYLQVWPVLPPMGQLFAVILVGGAIVQIFGFMHRWGKAEGLFPVLMMLILSLANLLTAGSKLEFFLAWEFMTVSSWMLIMRGRHARAAGLSYITFSLGAAFLIMGGLMLMPEFPLTYPLIWQLSFVQIGFTPLVLMLAGFLIKMGALGVHVWLPGAYAEAEDDSTALISSVLSKAGVFGMVLVLGMSVKSIGTGVLPIALGWIGVLTALGGALMAVFQEDVKKLLAYSSMSQLGYVVTGLSLMTHLGWMSALYLALTHMMFKALIFMAIAGVIYRTGTRRLYEMGGLIKKMPISFISVLMGIIAVSGVPPLTGFGSKWFTYTALIEQGRYLQTAVAFFSSAVAFLYLYKLIHTVFLGQPKPSQAHVKEAPIWFLIPQGVFIMLIMGASMFPNLITQPISKAIGDFIPKPEWLSWTGYNISLASPNLQAYWNGNLVMYVTMGVFMVPLIWLMLVIAKPQKVKQFNIVYAAERPYKPWTTHVAYNMFAHYQKALGSWVKPRAVSFWNGVGEWSQSLGATFARLYTGNGQTYLLHIFLYTIVMFMILGVIK